MIAKEVYKTLRSVVGPWCKARGFKPAKSSYLTYVAGEGAGPLLCFQGHHQGWEKHKGSKFTVWLQRRGGAELEPRAFNEPAPMIAIYLADWQPIEVPYKPTDDIWFRYFTAEDVRAWALVLLKYAEPLVERHR